MTTDPHGRIVKANRTFCAWVGHPREAIVGVRRIQDLLTIGARVFYDTHFGPLLLMQGTAHEIAFDLVCADGRQFPILLNAALKRDTAGSPRYQRLILFNAQQRRQYERELLLARRRAEESAKAKSDVIAMLSHDVRTPLGNIQLATNMLARANLPEPLQRYLCVLKIASDGLLGLVNGILEHSRVESGSYLLKERLTNLLAYLQDVTRGLSLKAVDKGITLRTEIDERLPELVLMDDLKVGQVLTNLLTNAVKFTEHGSVSPTVPIGVIEGDRVAVDFVVSDTGIGIPSARLPVIFDEFTQAGADTRRRYGGAGLGLSLCRKILALHGSTINVESTPGVGSTFSFTLQLKAAGESLERASRHPDERHRVRGAALRLRSGRPSGPTISPGGSSSR